MRIGIDLRVLQIGHQYRGIGETAKRIMNGIFELAVAETNAPEFIFYRYDDKHNPKDLLDIPKGLKYQETSLGVQPLHNPHRSLLNKIGHKVSKLYGNPLPQAKSCDILLQFDYALGVPRHPKTLLIKHDIIPYVFWNDYFTSPWAYFRKKAARTTLKTFLGNYEFRRVLRRSLKNAWKIICASEHTRKDLKRYFHVSGKKMQVVHWGASDLTVKTKDGKKPSVLPTKPFLMFVGAADPRRRVDDLIDAFNNIKADGHDIQLVLAGENFQSPQTLPNVGVRNAILKSSYKEDILTVGYIDDATKQDLYRKAVAFVFPTLYEGFGIPILEAMLLGCPVITYRNSSIPEVGGKYVFYAQNWESLKDRAEQLLAMDKTELSTFAAAARKHAQSFTWNKAAKQVYETLINR